MAVNEFSFIGSESAIHGFIEITVTKLNDANRARIVITLFCRRLLIALQ